jgi:hypothetical protein
MKKAIIILSSIFLFSNCATIITGSKQTVKFDSTPPNAKIFINNKEIGKTPYETKLERKECSVAIKLDGYKDFNVTLKKKTNGWVWGNILLGGIIGLVVDMSTGAIYRLTPNEINTQLGKTIADNTKNNNVYVFATLDAIVSSEKIGQLEKN